MRKGLLLTVLAALVLAGPARADSLVYTHQGHVWLAYPEGTQQTQLTKDQALYGSPSVADDGTIAAVWGGGTEPTFWFRTFDRNGEMLTNDVTPRANTNFFGPYWARISPDGSKIAFDMSYQHDDDLPGCPLTPTECQNKTWVTFTAVAEVGKDTPLKEIAFLKGWAEPTWIDDDRLLVSRTEGTDGMGVATLGGAPTTTVNPWSIQAGMTFYGGEVNRQGTRVALGTDNGGRITLWNLAGGAGSAASWCMQLQQPAVSFNEISWSPSGDGLAWREHDGIYTYVGGCDAKGPITKVIPYANAYSVVWGPGDIPGKERPKPQPTPTPTPTPIPTPSPTPTPTPVPRQPAAPTLAAAGKLPKLKRLGRSLGLRVTCDGACALSVTATIAKSLAKRLKIKPTLATARATGSGTVELALPKKVAKRLAKQKKLTVSVKATGTNSLGAPVSATATLRLKR